MRASKKSTIWYFAAGGFVWKKIHREKKKTWSLSFLSQQRGADCCGCGWCEGGGEVLVLPCRLVVCGVGATVYVVIVLQAVLGCSHHVWGFHRGSENKTGRDTNSSCCTNAAGSQEISSWQIRLMIYQMEGKKLHLQNQEVQFLPMCDILVILVKLQFVCKWWGTSSTLRKRLFVVTPSLRVI